MMTSIKVFGIPNCDSTQKAIKWLNAHSFNTTLHNYKTDGIDEKKLVSWCKKSTWKNILNKRSTTWKTLRNEEKSKVVNEEHAINAMLTNPNLIKRPVVEVGEKLMVGFNEQHYKEAFEKR